MTIIRWDPFRDFVAMHNDVGRLFDRTFGSDNGRTERVWAPAVDVYETRDEVVVKTELPGVKPEEVNVTLHEGTLHIKGERKFREEVKEENFYRLERRYGTFERTIPLPADIQEDKVAAAYKDGVLEITLPKAEAAKPKQIDIKIEAAKS